MRRDIHFAVMTTHNGWLIRPFQFDLIKSGVSGCHRAPRPDRCPDVPARACGFRVAKADIELKQFRAVEVTMIPA